MIATLLFSPRATLSRILGVMSLPYVTNPSTDTGKYMANTLMYAQKTDNGNLDAFFMSV